jgi:tetratricopeptide (TPR) repeat protein
MLQQMSSSELYERGLVLMELRMFHPAIDDFQTVAKDARYAGKAYVPMALCLKAIGQQEEAVAAFRQAIMSPMVSPVEQHHILYQLGQTLESLGRWAESLEVYGWIRKGDPGFRDVAQRMKYMSSGKGRLYSRIRNWWGALVNGVLRICSLSWTRQGNGQIGLRNCAHTLADLESAVLCHLMR